MYYKLYLLKNDANTYSGFDYCILKKNINGTPLNVSDTCRKVKKLLLQIFDSPALTVTEIAATLSNFIIKYESRDPKDTRPSIKDADS